MSVDVKTCNDMVNSSAVRWGGGGGGMERGMVVCYNVHLKGNL